MAGDDDWRWRRAAELFPDGVPIGNARRPPVERPDDVLPMRLPAGAPAAEPPPLREAIQPGYVRPRPVRLPRRSLAVGAAVAGAGLIGWLVGSGGGQVQRPPAVEPAIVAAVPSPSPAPAAPDLPAATVDAADPSSVPLPPVEVPDASTAPPATPATVAARPIADRGDGPRARAPVDRRRDANPTPLAGKRFAPSFNCRRATAASNRMICADRELARLDREMARAFRARMAGASDRTARAIDADQTSFLNERIACTSRNCIQRTYERRLQQLER